MVVLPTGHNLSASALEKSKNTAFPPIPRRGQVKAQIFDSIAKTFISLASKATGSINGGGENGCSSPATPPPSPSNSDTNSDMN